MPDFEKGNRSIEIVRNTIFTVLRRNRKAEIYIEMCIRDRFNIDYEGSINKDKTAVLRVFAKVFYNHLGFFGLSLIHI